jgi:DNA ligase-associated metallophosphoesterase
MYNGEKLKILGQHMILFADRAVFWREESMLILADPHFGKAQCFRDFGIPVPRGTSDVDLQRLSVLMNLCRPHKLLFLGDLIHGRSANFGALNQSFRQWRLYHSIVRLMLVSGNHDLRAGSPPSEFRFDRIAGRIRMDPFVFTHKPESDGRGYVIAGHVHPAVHIRGEGGLRERLPCFCFGTQTALLPAFGSFTGSQIIHPTPEDRVYVIAGDEVIEMRDTGSRVQRSRLRSSSFAAASHVQRLKK